MIKNRDSRSRLSRHLDLSDANAPQKPNAHPFSVSTSHFMTAPSFGPWPVQQKLDEEAIKNTGGRYRWSSRGLLMTPNWENPHIPEVPEEPCVSGCKLGGLRFFFLQTLFARGEGGVSFAKNGLTEEAGEIKNLIGALRIPFPLRSYLAHAGIEQHGREKLRVLVMNELRMPFLGLVAVAP